MRRKGCPLFNASLFTLKFFIQFLTPFIYGILLFVLNFNVAFNLQLKKNFFFIDFFSKPNFESEIRWVVQLKESTLCEINRSKFFSTLDDKLIAFFN